MQQTLSQTTILDSSELKLIADYIFKFDENGRKFSKWVENTVGKGEISRHKQFLLFPVFSKDFYYRHVKTRVCFEKGFKQKFFLEWVENMVGKGENAGSHVSRRPFFSGSLKVGILW